MVMDNKIKDSGQEVSPPQDNWGEDNYTLDGMSDEINTQLENIFVKYLDDVKLSELSEEDKEEFLKNLRDFTKKMVYCIAEGVISHIKSNAKVSLDTDITESNSPDVKTSIANGAQIGYISKREFTNAVLPPEPGDVLVPIYSSKNAGDTVGYMEGTIVLEKDGDAIE